MRPIGEECVQMMGWMDGTQQQAGRQAGSGRPTWCHNRQARPQAPALAHLTRIKQTDRKTERQTDRRQATCVGESMDGCIDGWFAAPIDNSLSALTPSLRNVRNMNTQGNQPGRQADQPDQTKPTRGRQKETNQSPAANQSANQSTDHLQLPLVSVSTRPVMALCA
mmetsp:Transcript_8480/g.24168  ORF Transcript_8480/g.24168 Transcript_8480/m.24168 type:complete len:166 (+) Transcript_8480:2050-2547(+)